MRALEELKQGLYVCRSEIHSFGTDAFLLTGFSRCRARDTVCDLGTGCGIIPLLMQRAGAPKHVYAVDIQPDAIDQLREGLAACDPAPAITPVCADLRDLWDDAPLHSLDLVTCNPPYKANEAGILSVDPQKQIARHETACSFSDICTAAAKLLRYHGRFCVCCRPERLTDFMCAMRESGIEPKRLRLVCPRPESAPSLILLEARRGGQPGLQIEAPLLLCDSEGRESAEYRRIYHR